MDPDLQLTSEDVRRLLELFSICHYKTRDNDKRTDLIQKVCTTLFARDYPELEIISNDNGELATSYPSRLIIPLSNSGLVYDCVDAGSTINRSNTLTNKTSSESRSFNSFSQNSSCPKNSKQLDVNKLKELISRARVARCRARFPVPVILYNDKYICRSATLSGGPEIYGRSGLDYLFNDYRNSSDAETNELANNLAHNVSESDSSSTPVQGLSLNNISDTSHLFSKVRNRDIELLKYLSVGYICDLMVEKKKVKFGMNVTSSEKADKESRYQEFNIMSLPYPGCEFFKDYRDNGYSAEGLIYDWKQHFVDADLIVPNSDEICERLNIDWKQYRSWDVIKLTQNYLKLLLLYLNEADSSILIHCISGWDRTPLFISLLRLSLWADGKIHQNLSPIEITFLTVSYDWFLFGHNLNDRLNKGEEILFFCFYFLKFFISDEFSVDFLINNSCKQRKTSVEQSVNGEDSHLLLEEPQSKYGGSCTSLNSSCSSASNRSHDNCPPLYFPCCPNDEFNNSFKSETNSNSSYGKTPPTLTNSEEGSDMFTSHTNSMDMSIINKCHCEQKSRPTPPAVIPNRPNPTRPTSASTAPVAIPKKMANTENGLSSLSRSDSWQLVSDTGSIRECSLRYSSPDSLSSPKANGNSADTSSSSNSDTQDTKNHSVDRTEQWNDRSSCLPKTNSMRKERLQAVRSIFYNSYSAAIGFKFKNGTDNSTRLASLIDQFAGSVGIYSNRVTAPQ